MFRKIVSNLSYSPALVGQLAFYAKRLRKEEATRRIGFFFVALALIVQGLTVFNPPQSANAAPACVNNCQTTCPPTVGDTTNPYCSPTPSLSYTKIITNVSQGNVNATTVTAAASDYLRYTITMTNNGTQDQTVTFKDTLTDVIEYATITDAGGAIYSSGTATLAWPQTTVAAGEQQSRTFMIRVKSDVPAAPQGTVNKTSYDCRITDTFGATTSVAIDCPAPKVVESVINELPRADMTTNVVFAIVLFIIVGFLYLRSRQIAKEVRYIRRHVNAGSI